jgi:hypothetical protein
MVVHEIFKNAVFGIVKAIFSDYESGGSKFESWHSHPFGALNKTRLLLLR